MIENRVNRMITAYEYLRSIGRAHKQQDIAEKMNTDKANVSRAMKGDKKYLTDRFLHRFNNAFDNTFNLDWLITGVGEMLNTKERELEIEDNIAENGDYNEDMIKRIKEIIELKSKSVRSFSDIIGVKQVTLNQQILGDRKLSVDTILAILNSFEDISAEWLLRGEGSMLKSDISNKETEEGMKRFLKQTDSLLAIRDEKIRKLELDIAALTAGTDIKEVG